MNKQEELKYLLSDTLRVDVSELNQDFSLKTGKLKTSAGSVILRNMVKKVYGVKIDCAEVTTLGELFALVETGESGEAEDRQDAMDMSETAYESEPFVDDHPAFSRTRIVCGVDIQEIDIFPMCADYWTESFYTENFTKDEIAYCVAASSPRHSFAARWCAKEALRKCGVKYSHVPFSDIQIVRTQSGAVMLEMLVNGSWQPSPFACSLSHTDHYAVSVVTGVEEG